MTEFKEKQEQFAELLENYLQDKEKKRELLNFVEKHEHDENFLSKELFLNIFAEIREVLSEMSDKEIKQRILMVKSYS
ncbi:MAG: hypothetical protein H6500_00825 [Candidatus Woesearchaeota archaeon]|nr:hypothetical protein [Nanoarchaeota archaeon]USN44376.1 MAG: hypothetical protein H6500_00825 [Candidatus Woesearchaeota archaeon]